MAFPFTYNTFRAHTANCPFYSAFVCDNMAKLQIGLCVIVVLIALIGPRIYRLNKFLKYGQIAKNHQPGPCHLVPGIEHGSEDIEFVTEGVALITSGLIFKKDYNIAPWKDVKGQIFLLDFNKPDTPPVPVKISGENFNEKEFNPHGISTWTDDKTGVITVFIVNHKRKEEVIDKLIFEEKAGTLKHTESIKDEAIVFPNDVVAMSDITFYVTNYQKYPHNHLLGQIEVLGMFHLGDVVYYDGQKARVVADSLLLPNGINKSPDSKYLYMMHIGQTEVLTYEIQSDFSLSLAQSYPVDTAGDNINVDKNGDLWIGGHPVVHKTLEGMEHPFPSTQISPSHVIKLTTKDGLITDIFEPYINDGRVISYATVALTYNKKLFIGTISGKALLCDLVYF